MEMLTNSHPLVNETCPRWKSHERSHEHDTRVQNLEEHSSITGALLSCGFSLP